MADTVVQIFRQILDAVSADGSVNAWLLAHFPGESLHQYLGLDLQKLPTAKVWHAAIPQSCGLMDDMNNRQPGIMLAVSIEKEGQPDMGNFVEFSGFALVSDLAELIQTAAMKAFDQNAMNLSAISIDIDYPYFRASWSFRVPTETA